MNDTQSPRDEVGPDEVSVASDIKDSPDNPRVADSSEPQQSPKRKPLDQATVLKFAGLVAFFVLIIIACVVAWPTVSELFAEGGLELVISTVKDAGIAGAFILLGMQFLQIVVAFIPGEITQIAAGMIYGPWLGAAILLLGCVVSSAFIFLLVRKLGAPFVQGMVPIQYLEKFRKFEEGGKFNTIVFILFLIPGLPKDVFTYLVPLTDMRMRDFLLLSNIGRIPGIIVTTYAADGLMDGRIWESVIIFAIAAVILLVGVLCRERIMKVLDSMHNNSKDSQD